MRKKRKLFSPSNKTEESLINITPLIDVVFVVLIAFILIAPLLQVDHISLAKATLSSKKDIESKHAITIFVREDNSIWVNNKLCDLDKLTFTLRNLRQMQKSLTPPQLFHDEKATFGTYQNVKDALEKAGFLDVDVILKSK